MMALSADQERVKTLLKDTISLLCKNGLSFDKEFKIDAVIGITLDKNKLFYISMNDTFKSEAVESLASGAEDEYTTSNDSYSQPSSPKSRKKKRRNSSDSESAPNLSEKRRKDIIDLSQSDSVKEENVIFVKEEPGEQETWKEVGAGDDPDLPGTSMLENLANKQKKKSDSTPSKSGFSVAPNVPFENQGNWTASGPPLLTPERPHQASAPPSTSNTDPSFPTGQMSLLMALRNEADIQCSFCGKKFTNKYNLKRHENAHFGIHPYMCTICQKGFTSRECLKGHMSSVHHVQREFRCEVCGKEFTQKVHLKSHQSIHNTD